MKLSALLAANLLVSTTLAQAQQDAPIGERAVAKASASYKCLSDPIEALNDGREPKSSQDGSIPHLSFHPHVGTFEWVQYDFASPQRLEGCAVYWNSDQHIAKKSPTDRGVGLPDFWKVIYQNETGDWLPVEGQPPAPSLDAWNVCRFKPVEAKTIRLAIQQTSESSAGIVEWKLIPFTGTAFRAVPPPFELRLDDLIPFSAKVGFKDYRVNKYSLAEEKQGGRVLIDGAACEHFLFAHANSAVSFTVPAGFTRFSAVGIGPTKQGWKNYSWIYQVDADGKQVFQSQRLDTYPDHQAKIEVELPTGTKTMTLITNTAGPGVADHSIWANPKLLQPPFSPETKTKLSQLETQFKSACAKIEPFYAQAMLSLDAKYLASVQQAYNAAYQSGDNSAVSALLEEIRRVKEKGAMPATDRADAAAILVSLRNGYRTSVSGPAAARATQLQPIYNSYDASLISLAKALADKPAEASAVNAIRSRLAATRPAAPVIGTTPAPAPVVKPMAADKKPEPAVVQSSSNMARVRKLVEKVISLNPNGVRLIVDRQVVDQRTLPLPARSFEIQELGIGGEKAKAITNEDVEALAGERSLQVLSLNDTSITRLDALKSHHVLRVLSLNGNPLTDDALKAIEGMTSLQELSLSGTKLSDSGLASAAGCGNLRSLGLWGTQITDDGLSNLSRLKDLNRLYIGNTKVKGAGIKNLASLAKLSELSLDNLTLESGALDVIPQLKSLTVLNLDNTKLESTLLTRVGARAGLEALSLNGSSVNGTPISDSDLREFAGLAKLKRLYLTSTNVTGTGFSTLVKARNLEQLEIEGTTPVSDEGLRVAIRTFPDLAILVVSGKITGESLASLNQLRKLKHLRLNGPDLTDASVGVLPPLRSLETLELSAPHITAAVSAALARQSNLTRLLISGTAVNDEAIPDLIKIKGLRELNLGTAPISAAGVEKLKKALPACTVTR